MELTLNTLFTGKVLKLLASVDSTNSYARDLVANSAPIEGTAIIALRQTAGRGQIGNQWQSMEGKDLTFSLIYRPEFLNGRQLFDLNILVSVAISHWLESLEAGVVKIKWPNDILLNGRKVCGILIENGLQGHRIRQSIIGVGLNLNSEPDWKSLPHATSVLRECGRETPIELAYQSLLENLEAQYLRRKSGRDSDIRKDYLARLAGLDENSRMSVKGVEMEGVIRGIDQEGRLEVDFGEEQLRFRHGEVKQLIFD